MHLSEMSGARSLGRSENNGIRLLFGFILGHLLACLLFWPCPKRKGETNNRNDHISGLKYYMFFFFLFLISYLGDAE